METVVFGGGCFWCTEAIFQNLKGVSLALPGYSGGTQPNPTYEDIHNNNTGHVEATKIEFDPAVIKFADLLNVFFATHDPTSLNRQGNDVGEEYRSVIFYMDEGQKAEAEEYIRALEKEKVFSKPIVTAIEPFKAFYDAEDYHLNFYKNNPNSPYCQFVIDPKIAKLRQKFAPLLKSQ